MFATCAARDVEREEGQQRDLPSRLRDRLHPQKVVTHDQQRQNRRAAVAERAFRTGRTGADQTVDAP